jgi:hypothetical protein
MADKSDVEIALVDILSAAFQQVDPNPAVLTNATVGSTTFPLRIFRGWVQTDQMQEEVVANGGTYVSIYTPPVTRNTSRGQSDWSTVSKAPQTASLTVSGASVTVQGTGSASINMGIAYGSTGWAYRPSDGESAASIAAVFAAAIPNASVSGATVTLDTSLPVFAKFGADSTSAREVLRIDQRFQFCVWAPDTILRDLVAARVTSALAVLNTITLDDGTVTENPRYIGSPDSFPVENIGVERRDVVFNIEFPVLEFQTQAAVLFVGLTMKDARFGIFKPGE